MAKITFEEYSKIRNAEIVQLIEREFMTMTAVAKRFGISKQRVQQIYSREKWKNV
jgi:DNA-directed RNA polymerase specialized sigma subunit|tara:strand:+ start:355 stop:519 length:165 start_codon:yes stop_codon:yes gene_type:complete